MPSAAWRALVAVAVAVAGGPLAGVLTVVEAVTSTGGPARTGAGSAADGGRTAFCRSNNMARLTIPTQSAIAATNRAARRRNGAGFGGDTSR
jgi:hypothetical protein